MRKQYKMPPLIEAVCEFRFESDQNWDWTIPGLFYEQIKKQFPIKKQSRNAVQVESQAQDDQILQQIRGVVAPIQFFNQTETVLVQVTQDLLSINHLKPYTNWANFKQIIETVLTNYKEVTVLPKLKRIGLRYINRIEIPISSFPINDYFNIGPGIPEGIPPMFSDWAHRVTIPYPKTNDVLVFQAGAVAGAIQDEEIKSTILLLDLDFSTKIEPNVNLDNYTEWLEQAHTQIEVAFEACVTSKAKKQFEGN